VGTTMARNSLRRDRRRTSVATDAPHR